MVAKILKVKRIDIKDKYLGAPLFIDKSKHKSFEGIVRSLDQRIQGWKGKLLSQAGRTTMTKSVLGTIQTFQSACFLLPATISSKLNGLQRDFWWGKAQIYWGSGLSKPEIS
ncbi:hypothetical protein BVC80_1345g12 [Macleaya cordata]|uniref:Reverse transcriptase domain n=1 Tax=Macleaya cordata TaxID=56857 RepID=A0A200QKC8_MACCD|nr:hypothetical protein BVC80_1345g12 [Macleaya cordata]